MKPKEWHTLASFGLLAGALALYDPKLALLMVGVASAVVLVKNADDIRKVLP